MVPDFYRTSPIRMKRPALRKEFRNGWEIVMQYEDEGNAPWLIDLSHAQKFDCRDHYPSRGRFLDIPLPEEPEQCIIQRGFVSARLNQQCSIVLNLSPSPISVIDDAFITDVTDAFALLAMIGHSVFEIIETITSLDLFPPGKNIPFVLQGPVLHIRSLIFLLSAKIERPAILLAVPRGYGQSLFTALLQAGQPWNLSPAGHAAFLDFFKHLIF